MRIGLLAPLWNDVPPKRYGGTERIIYDLARGLIGRGHDVTLLASGTSQCPGKLHPVLPETLMAMMAKGQAFFEQPYHLQAAFEATKLAQQGNIDVLHSHLGLHYLPLFHGCCAPTVTTIHSAVTHDDIWITARFPDAQIVAVSNAQAAPLLKSGHGRVEVIHNAVNFDEFPAGPGGGHLLFLGRTGPHKNPAAAIRLAKLVQMPLVLAGGPRNAEEKRYFDAEVYPHIDGKLIRYVGPVNQREKLELLSKAVALVFAIEWDEPFGIVMIEAMACGTPVLAYNRWVVPEIVEPGVTGELASDFNGLVAAMPTVLKLDRKQVREAARARFDQPKMVDSYIKVYRDAISAKPR